MPSSGPLSDIKVLDLTLARAGPTCVRQLADWGADAVKIEAPGRADQMGPERHDPDFQNLHRGKRAMTLNLKSEQGKEIFFQMLDGADVVVENMRADVKHRLGIDYESCRARNPRIVYGSISGFGQDGPYASRAGVDQIAQGMGGLMSITGLPGQGPVRVGVPIADLSAGVYLALGVMVALYERQTSGVGQWVTTSLLEAQIAMLDFQATRWTMNGEVPPQAGNHHPTGIPMGAFPSADGHVNVAAPSGEKWRTFCELIGAPHLRDDPNYKTGTDRSRNRDALNSTIADFTAKQPTDHWIDVLNDAGIPCGPVYSIDQTFADPQVQHLKMAVPVEHPTLGSIDIIRNNVRMSRSPSPIRSHSPDMGEHTDEVLTELGFASDEIEALRADGVV